MKKILLTLLALGLIGTAQAGNIMLTGHDVLLHSGQNGHDAVALDYLRDGTAKADYDIAVVGGGAGFARFTGQASNFAGSTSSGSAISLTGTLSGYSSATYWRADLADASDWTTILSADVLVVLSHTSCGGCDSTNASSAALNAQSADIATAFNAGMDIWGISGASLATFYDFLPPGAVASGLPIGGSSGFDCTAAGAAIGLLDNRSGTTCGPGDSMINGFPTHNRFVGYDDDFEVFEVRDTEDITIGIKDAIITDDGIGTIDDTDGTGSVPEPSTLLLLSLGLLGLGAAGRRRR